MKYCSTRGGISGWSFEQALFSTGIVQGGGLLMPESIPCVSHDTLQQWKELSYPELCKEIVPLFISEEEIPKEDISKLLDRAFAKFPLKEVVKVAKLKEGLNIAELWHGKTLAFKDLALSCVGQFLEFFLSKQKRHVTIVVATSGDTGSSAIEAIRGLEWVDIIVLLPKGRISNIQELMMTTVLDDNVHVIAAEDVTSDGLDDVLIGTIYNDEEFKIKHNLCTINSINWARVMVQIAHYFYSYFQVCKSVGQTVEIVVPTGAAGNITAGCIAKFMGLPIKLVAVVNKNDIVFRTLENGDHSLAESVIPSLAPAMDIQSPYNFQRILWLFSAMDTEFVDKLMNLFENDRKFELSSEIMKKLNAVLSSYKLNDDGILQTMKTCWHDNQFLVCPHTAIAVSYVYGKTRHSTNEEAVPRVCLATASPAKFPEAVLEAGLTPQTTPAVEALLTMQTKSIHVKGADDLGRVVRNKIESITSKVKNKTV